MEVAERIKSVEEYYFSKKLKEVRALESQGKPILNLGIGNPNMPPPASVVDVLVKSAKLDGVHGYQSYQGIPELRESIRGHYKNYLGVSMEDENVLPLIGSKEGIFHVSMAYLNKGDKVLIPEIGYPTYSSVTKLCEAEAIYYPLNEENSWEPDWTFFHSLDWENIKIIWINYPHMPTGQNATDDWFEKFHQLSLENNCLLVHDNPYSYLSMKEPKSIFSYKVEMKNCIELGSVSKTYNMAGWRVGWIVGDSEVIKNILKVKSNMDSGMFKPVQLAACEALNIDRSWYSKTLEEYSMKRKLAEKLAKHLNLTFQNNQKGMFLWCHHGTGVDEFVDKLLYEKSIFITPGKIFGRKGKEYIRISLSTDKSIIEEAISRVS